MRVVGFDELCSLPVGTVFSYLEGIQAVGLYRRGEVIRDEYGPQDFFESPLLGQTCNGGPPECDPTESRWGLYDYRASFLIYEPDDIATIAEGLGITSPQ